MEKHFTGAIDPDAPKPSELLTSALNLLGSRGQHWTQGVFRRYRVDLPILRGLLGRSYCALGALVHVNTDNQLPAEQYLRIAANQLYKLGIVDVNDKKDFNAVVAMFNTAISMAKEDGN